MLDRGLRSMPSHDRADGPRYRRCSLPQLIQSLSIDTIKSINDKQSLLGADFDLIVLSPSSTALVNYGLGNLKSLADGVGVSITGVGMTESFVDLAHTAGCWSMATRSARPAPQPTPNTRSSSVGASTASSPTTPTSPSRRAQPS